MRMSHTQINCTCKVDLFTLYFRLLWYHSISRGSIDQSTLKQTKFEDKTVKSTQPLLVLIGLHDFLIFSNRTVHAWSVEAGNICSVSVFFVRVGGQISPRRAKKDSNIPSPGRARSVKCPTPGPTKTIKSPPQNNVKKIIAVKDATSALAKKRPEKIQSCRGLNLKPLKKEINKKINKYQEDHPGKTDFFQAFFSQLHIYMLHIFIISRDY